MLVSPPLWAYVLMGVCWVAWDAITLGQRRFPYVERPHVLHDAAREAWKLENERRERAMAAAQPVAKLRRLFKRVAA